MRTTRQSIIIIALLILKLIATLSWAKYSRLSLYAKQNQQTSIVLTAIIIPISGISKIKCGFHCLNHPLCQSFFYSLSKICSLHQKTDGQLMQNNIEFFGPISSQALHCFENGVEICVSDDNYNPDPCNMQLRLFDRISTVTSITTIPIVITTSYENKETSISELTNKTTTLEAMSTTSRRTTETTTTTNDAIPTPSVDNTTVTTTFTTITTTATTTTTTTTAATSSEISTTVIGTSSQTSLTTIPLDTETLSVSTGNQLTSTVSVNWGPWSDWGPYVADFCYGYGLIGMAVYSNISHLVSGSLRLSA